MVNWVSTIVTCAGYAIIARFVHVYAHARRNKVGNSQLDFSELTVLVPFRNEENRIQTLLASLNEQAKLPMVFFIDDHSTDATRKVIADTATFAHTVLTSSKEGKKAAINEGMDHVTTSHVLTLDSDVALPMGYFEEVLKLGEADVSILPVEMKGEGIVAGFFRWEYQLQRRSWAAFGRFHAPMTGSGANLLFKRKTYFDLLEKRQDWTLLSGDDHFLVQAAVKAGFKVEIIENEKLTVVTNAERTWIANLNQRWRWLGKTTFQPDWKGSVFGAVLLLMQVTYYALMIYTFSQGHLFVGLGLFLIKADLDGFVTGYSFMKNENTTRVWMYEVLYPVYVLHLLLGLPFARPTWKGRGIKKASQL